MRGAGQGVGDEGRHLDLVERVEGQRSKVNGIHGIDEMDGMDGMMRKQDGFTLIELLVVVAIIGILAGILVPLAGKATGSAKARKASMEAQGLVVAVSQFHDDHHYMPWAEKGAAVGDDKWAATDDSAWMDVLQGKNAKKKNYLSAKLTGDG